MLSFTATLYVILCLYPWEACPFLKRSREGVYYGRFRGEVGRGNGRKGEKGNCSQGIKSIKKVNLKKNEYSQSILSIA